jgi:hypothetical protein
MFSFKLKTDPFKSTNSTFKSRPTSKSIPTSKAGSRFSMKALMISGKGGCSSCGSK